MNLDRFTRERQPAWTELEQLIGRAGRRPERLGADGVLRLGALYRAATADLALARRSFPGDPVVGRLEHLVGRARGLVYDTPMRRLSLVQFFRREYWRLIASRPLPLLLAMVLLFAPAALAGAWAQEDPGAAIGLVPGELRPAAEPGLGGGMSAEQQAAFSSEIFTNNIRVAFFAFAGGIAAGLITALVLMYNGVILGAVGSLAIGAGSGPVFFQLVVPHGVLELSCIVVAGAAGLRLGWALVDPGRQTRADSLVTEARRAVALVLGTIPWLVLAGIVEGFVTASVGFESALAIGLALGTTYWALVLSLGRAQPLPPATASPAASRAGMP